MANTKIYHYSAMRRDDQKKGPDIYIDGIIPFATRDVEPYYELKKYIISSPMWPDGLSSPVHILSLTVIG